MQAHTIQSHTVEQAHRHTRAQNIKHIDSSTLTQRAAAQSMNSQKHCGAHSNNHISTLNKGAQNTNTRKHTKFFPRFTSREAIKRTHILFHTQIPSPPSHTHTHTHTLAQELTYIGLQTHSHELTVRYVHSWTYAHAQSST
jgi:hypothetical protein